MPWTDKLVGEPDVESGPDRDREMRVARLFAERADVVKVYIGDEARKLCGARTSGQRDPFPDVVAVTTDGDYGLGEGKGTDLGKAIEQFESAGKLIRQSEQLSGRVNEQIVVVPKLTSVRIDRKIYQSPGPGFRIDGEKRLMYFGETESLAKPNGVVIRVYWT